MGIFFLPPIVIKDFCACCCSTWDTARNKSSGLQLSTSTRQAIPKNPLLSHKFIAKLNQRSDDEGLKPDKTCALDTAT
jgi:hypothetical protein